MKKFLKTLLGITCAACLVSAAACSGGEGATGGIFDDELNYKPAQSATAANTYAGITIDGVLSEGEWDKYTVFEGHPNINATEHVFKMAATTCEEGVVLMYSLRGGTAYYNPANSMSNGSSIELYIANGDVKSITGNSWQIELLPNGIYNTTKCTVGGSYYQYNSYIDYNATVHGTINADNDGYDGEAMIPWSMLGGKRTTTVSMDAAIISQNSYENGRSGWYSITESLIGGWNWNDPTTWIRFTEYGWFDKNDAVVYKVNDGNELEHATVEMTGTYNQGSVFNIVPEDGYVLKTLKINGKDYNTLSTAIPTGTVYADIQIEVGEAVGSKLTVPVVSGYAYRAQKALKNTAITLVNKNDETDFYAGMTDENGVLTVYAPDGEYVAEINGSSEVSIIVENGAITNLTGDNITLVKSGIIVDYMSDAVKDDIVLEQTADGDSLIFNGTFLAVSENRFVVGYGVDYSKAAMTFTVGDTHGGWIDLRVDTVNSKNALVTPIEHSSNAGNYSQFGFRTDGNNSTFQLGAAATNTASTKKSADYMVIFSTEDSVTTVKLFVKNGDTYEYFGYFKCAQVTNLFLAGCGGNWSNQMSFTNLKIYEGEDADSLITVANDSSAQVEVSSEEKAFVGDSVKVTVTPKAASSADKEVTIKEVYVNGKKVEIESYYDGSVEFYIIVEELGKNYEIKVVTEEIAKREEISFNATHKYPKEDSYYAITNAKIAFISAIGTNYAMYVDGSSYKVKLSDGTYTVKVEGHNDATVEVVDGVMTPANLELERLYVTANLTELDKDKVQITYNDGAYNIKTTGALSIENYIVVGQGVDYTDTVVTMDVDWLRNIGTGDGSQWIDFRMDTDGVYKNEKNTNSAIYAPKGSNGDKTDAGTYYMFGINSNTWTCQYTVGAGSMRYFEFVDITMPYTTCSASYAFTFKTAENKTTVTMYIKLADGTYAKIGQVSGAAVKSMFLLGDGGSWAKAVEINNIRFYENGSKNIDVAVGTASNENVNVTFSKNKVALGETVTVTATPKATEEGVTVTITKIEVNGTELTLSQGENGAVVASFVANKLDVAKYEVVVTAVVKGNEQEYTFNATHKFVGETTATAITGDKITFVMGAETTDAVYSDGAYKVTLATGTYTVKIWGHNDITVEVTEDGMSETLAFTRDKVFVNLAEDGADKVNVTYTDGAYNVKTTGALSNQNLIVIGNGIDYTDALITMDINFLVNVWSNQTNIWVDFRMNTDDVYDNEQNESAHIYKPNYGNDWNGNSVGGYYMFDLFTNSNTLTYTVGSGDIRKYIEFKGDNKGLYMPYDTASTSIAFAFETAEGKTTVSLYVMLKDGTYGKIGDLTGAALKEMFLLGCGGGWNNAVEFNNIRVYENVSKSVVLGEASNENVETTLSVNKAGFNETVTVTATPKTVEGYTVSVTDIKVNGKALDVTVGENGTVTATFVTDDVANVAKYEVVVEARLKTNAIDVIFNATHKFYDQKDYTEMDNATITFVYGFEKVNAVYDSETGKYTVTIVDGTYTVKAANHEDLVVTIENGIMTPADIAMIEERILVTTTEATKNNIIVTKADGAYNVKTTSALSTDNRIVIGNGLDYTDALITMDVNWLRNFGAGNGSQWIDFRMDSDGVYSNEWNTASTIYAPKGSNGDGTNSGPYYMFNFNCNSYTCQYKVGSGGDMRYFEFVDITMPYTTCSASYAFTFKTAENKTTVTMYIKLADGTYAKIAQLQGAAVKSMFLLGAGGAWDKNAEFNNIRFYENASQSVVVGESSNENVNVTFSTDKVALGETVTVTATPKTIEGKTVTVSGIKANGKTLEFTTDANGVATATFTADVIGKQEVVVEALTAGITNEVALTLKEKIATESTWRKMTAGTVLSFYNAAEKNTRTATYNGEEDFTVTMEDGTWTVSANGYKSVTVEVVNGVAINAELNMQKYMLVSNGVNASTYTITEDENGADVVFNAAAGGGFAVLSNPYEGRVIIKATYTSVAETWEDRMATLDANLTKNLEYVTNIGPWSTNLYVKWHNDNNLQAAYAKDGHAIDGIYTIRLVLVVDGQKVEGYSSIMKSDGTYEPWVSRSYTLAKEYVAIGFSSGEACSFTDVTIEQATPAAVENLYVSYGSELEITKGETESSIVYNGETKVDFSGIRIGAGLDYTNAVVKANVKTDGKWMDFRFFTTKDMNDSGVFENKERVNKNNNAGKNATVCFCDWEKVCMQIGGSGNIEYDADSIDLTMVFTTDDSDVTTVKFYTTNNSVIEYRGYLKLDKVLGIKVNYNNTAAMSITGIQAFDGAQATAYLATLSLPTEMS